MTFHTETLEITNNIKMSNKTATSDGVIEWIDEEKNVDLVNQSNTNGPLLSDSAILAGGVDLQTPADTSRLLFEVNEMPGIWNYFLLSLSSH